MDEADVLARLEKFEGRVPHMYRCTGGEVTIGIGHAILAAADAAQLSWNLAGQPAPPPRVQADYAAVAAADKGLVATHYAGLTECRMNDADIDRVAASDIQRFIALLQQALPNWNSYPAPAQAALFDMAYNLGIGGLKKFSHMLAAVDAGDWATAAAQCHRQGIGDQRNQETAALFLQAAG
jgi:GH24 family phage-related lysozyme (muramidase)